MNTTQALGRANELKIMINMGYCKYEDGMEELKACLAILDDKAKEIAKKHKRKHYGFSPTAFLR